MAFDHSSNSSFAVRSFYFFFLVLNFSVCLAVSDDSDFGKLLFEAPLIDVDLAIIPGLRDDDDFDHWKPPPELQKDAPTYITGFDNSSRPVWVMEWGKYNFGKYAKTKKSQALFDKHIRYLSYVGLKSHSLKSTPEHHVHQHVKIFDFEGFKLDFFTDRRVLQYQMRMLSNYRRYFEKHIGRLIIINVNPISETWLNIARPFILRLLDRMEVYGTNKNVWGPILAKSFTPDLLPEWYGGSKDFKPLYVVG